MRMFKVQLINNISFTHLNILCAYLHAFIFNTHTHTHTHSHIDSRYNYKNNKTMYYIVSTIYLCLYIYIYFMFVVNIFFYFYRFISNISTLFSFLCFPFIHLFIQFMNKCLLSIIECN